MTLGWNIYAEGIDSLEAKFSLSAKNAEDTLNIMYSIFVDMLAIEEKLFNSQGRRGGR